MLMISNLVSSMTGDRTPKPSFVLTDEGLNKLEYLLKRYFPDRKKIYNTHIQAEFSLDRATIGKIRKRTAGVNEVTLESFFDKLVTKCQEKYPKDNFDNYYLENSDYQEFHNNNHKTSPKPSKQSVENNSSENIINALKKLNYNEQEKDFRDYITKIVENKYAATFLIHGQYGYGQRWLVNRLCEQVDDGLTTAFCHPINLTKKHRDIQRIWDDIAAKVGSSSRNPQTIVDVIYTHWQTQPILLCFHNVDVVGCQELNKFIEPFWKYLHEKIKHPNTVNTQPLLLFLIDNYGQQKFSNLFNQISKEYDIENNILLEIKELDKFSDAEIKIWTKCYQKIFKSHDAKSNLSEITQEIISYNNTPIQAIEYICQCFDLNWKIDIERTLPL